MDELEEQLKRALAQAMTRRDPPPDFTAKVMARVAAAAPDAARAQATGGAAAPASARWWQIVFLPAARHAALAGGFACMLVVGASVVYHQHQVAERRQAEDARNQLMVALRITSTQLNHVSRVLAPSSEREK